MAAEPSINVIPPAPEIPLTFRASLSSWWSTSSKQGAIAEERIFRRFPWFTPSSLSEGTSTPPVAASDAAVTAKLSFVDLSPKRFLNMLSILPNKPAPAGTAPPPTVFLPGYGAGIGFFFLNFPALATWAGNRGAEVYAVDWLGMGRSARVPFTVKAKRDDIDGRVEQAESFFIDALEEWRVKMGHETMSLVGHSLGAYLSTAYALRYPDRVSKLILLSPAGVPHDPNAVVDTTVPSRELHDDAPPTASPASAPVPATESKVKDMKKVQAKEKREESTWRKVATYLWEEGVSPFQLVRSSLFWGPMLVGNYTSRRFAHLSDEDKRDFHQYLWHITRSKGSGEYCISHILAPFAQARRPLVDRVHALKIPVTFLYGEHDWMDPLGGMQSVEKLKQAGNPNAKMYVIPGAGHHLYLDNPRLTNDLLIQALDRPFPNSPNISVPSSTFG
ncbi:hypothetical protein BOTBODRAFT_71125 [Botryobasidium botryosum FD-172 SS1]|uniref:AB hydrolase-1 domain-containing protein n=1 Tax=Botryobasidium botryosum (strain FD-172 SS1) TaxID=930990 RepID=A0A067LSJ9_BOTB1|nr:hypothetical protein BOTBODRAFT_71125 [Botryobasidium botryosum FD-172 SS1]